MRTQIRQAVTALQNKFSIEMMKLPKNVRQMPVHEFFLVFGGDVKAAIAADVQRATDVIRKTPGKARPPTAPAAVTTQASTGTITKSTDSDAFGIGISCN